MPKALLPSVVESLESRQFRSVTYYNDGSQVSADGTFFGSILFGDNGDEYGVPTSASGVNNQVIGTSYSNWDTDIDDGLDTGLKDVMFGINTSSTHKAFLTVDTQLPGYFSVSPSTAIHSVQIRASVAGPGMEFAFQNIEIDFYRGSSVVESIDVNDVIADTRNSASWDPAESVAVITPSQGNISGVQVSARFQMKANAGVYPGQTDVGGQIFVS